MIELRPLTDSEIETHNAGEDEAVIRWLTGGAATRESTRRHFAALAENAAREEGKRGLGLRLDNHLASYVDFDPDATYLSTKRDVHIAHAVHPWARRRGTATSAVLALKTTARSSDHIRDLLSVPSPGTTIYKDQRPETLTDPQPGLGGHR